MVRHKHMLGDIYHKLYFLELQQSIIEQLSMMLQLNMSSAHVVLTTSMLYFGCISVRHCLANGVRLACTTMSARKTFSLFILSAKVLMVLTPTLSSFG